MKYGEEVLHLDHSEMFTGLFSYLNYYYMEVIKTQWEARPAQSEILVSAQGCTENSMVKV